MDEFRHSCSKSQCVDGILGPACAGVLGRPSADRVQLEELKTTLDNAERIVSRKDATRLDNLVEAPSLQQRLSEYACWLH